MAYLISQCKAELEGILHGTTTNQISNLDSLIYRAARQLLLDIDPSETKRIVQMTTPIFSKIYNYALPTDVKGSRIIDIYPAYSRKPGDDFQQHYNKDFDRNSYQVKQSDFTVIHNTGIKTVRIDDQNGNNPVVLTDANTTTGWTVIGGGSNIRIDNINFVSAGASVQFDMSTAVTGGLEFNFTPVIDLTTYLNQSSQFVYVYLPTATDITSVEFRWGTNNTNYYSRVLTVAADGTTFVNGWNLIKADWLGATVTGTPTVTSIGYTAINITKNANTQTGVKVDAIQCIMGRIMNIEYYSKYLFTASGAFQETVTDDSNTINLDTESYNLLLYIVAAFAVQQQQGRDMLTDNNFFWTKYLEMKKRYMAMYKSEVIKPQQTYYAIPKPGYTKYIGRRYN